VETTVFFPAIRVWGTYLLIIAGIVLAGVKLTSHVAEQAIALALPLISISDPTRLSLVEQRRMAAASGLQPSPQDAIVRVAAMEASDLPPGKFAADLDRAERADLPASALRGQRTTSISANDLISFPPAPRYAAVRWKGDRFRDERARRARYAALRYGRNVSRRYPSAADDFNRRFGPSLADAR
jgi:hypothetical protein